MSTLLEESATLGKSVGGTAATTTIKTLGWNGWTVAIEGYTVQQTHQWIEATGWL